MSYCAALTSLTQSKNSHLLRLAEQQYEWCRVTQLLQFGRLAQLLQYRQLLLARLMGRYCFARCGLSASVVVCNTAGRRACRRAYGRPTLHGGPVVLRIRARPCCNYFFSSNLAGEARLADLCCWQVDNLMLLSLMLLCSVKRGCIAS